MIDLDRLGKKIDELLENETSSNLTKWLNNKRYGNLNTILGKGSFINLTSHNKSLFIKENKTNFSSGDNYDSVPQNRKAA